MLTSKPVWLVASGYALALLLLSGTYAAPATPDAADEAMFSIRPEAIRADMRFLSDDLLEGRGTATRGHEIAAKFMATQFEGLGLQPAGDAGTYFQEVPLRSVRPDEAKSAFAVTGAGKEQTLAFRTDYILGADPSRPEVSVEAAVVFVGYGVTAPDQGYDDYKQIDAKGKIVALLFGAPKFESSLKAHYSSGESKQANAVAHGAVGIILVDDPGFEQIYSFSKRVRDLITPEYRWLDKQGQPNDYFPQIKVWRRAEPRHHKEFFRRQWAHGGRDFRGGESREAAGVRHAHHREDSHRQPVGGRAQPERGRQARRK
jgi:hypothetical protein